VRVKVDVAGNSYKMVARLFSTEGEAPAELPVSTKSRTCDVCTVAEARDYIVRLADAVRPDLEEPVAPPPPPVRVPPPPPPPLLGPSWPRWRRAGDRDRIALFATMPDCHADTGPAPATTTACAARWRAP